MTQLTSEVLRRAADLSDEIAERQAELNQLLAGQIEVESTTSRVTGGKRKFSPEAIKAIQAAQRRRWRNVRKAKVEAQTAITTPQTAAPTTTVEAPAAPAPVASPTAATQVKKAA